MIPAAMFVDGANWSRALHGKRINFTALVREVERVSRLRIVYQAYYTTYHTQEDLDRRMPFLEVLKRRQWQVFAMPAKFDPFKRRYVDKEVDVAIALDAYQYVTRNPVKALVLGSGDEDYCALYRRLPDGIVPWCVTMRETTSAEVRATASVIELDNLKVFRENGDDRPEADAVPRGAGEQLPPLQVDPGGSREAR